MNDIEVSSIDLVEGGNVFKQGHYLTLGYVPRDEKGETVDLSGKTLNVSLWGRKGVVFEAAATYSAGVIRFTLDKMVPAGDYTVEFTVTSSTDSKYRKKFPTNQHSGRIAIKQSADDLGVVGIQVYTVAQLKAEQKAIQTQYESTVDAKMQASDAKSTTALTKSTTAEATANDVKSQFEQVVISGDSSVEAAAARVAPDQTFVSLKARLDAKEQATALQLVEIETDPTFKSSLSTESAPLGLELVDGTGWVVPTGWTGDFATGFTNTVGNTNALSKTMGLTGTKLFQVSFRVESPTGAGVPNASTDFSVTIGNSAPFVTYQGGGNFNYTFGIQSVSDGDLKFIPGATFNGTIKNVSVKEIVGQVSPSLNIEDADGNSTIEIRGTKTSLQNVFIGKGSGKSNTTGRENVALGDLSLNRNTTGYWNNAIGKQALEFNTTGSRNIGLGFYSLKENISGDRNIAIGTYTLQRNTHGRQNIALGADALWVNTTGSRNIVMGMGAMGENTIGNENIALGYIAMEHNISGGNNIALGQESLLRNQYNSNQIAIGRGSLKNSNPTDIGGINIAIGSSSLVNATIGISNTAIGQSSGSSVKDGNENVAIGHYAMANGVAGKLSQNVVIGAWSGGNLTEGGINNTLIGYGSGRDLTLGNNNILIGRNINASSPTASGEVNIGGIFKSNTFTKRVTLGDGITNPTARLHLPSQTASAQTAPLKFESGVLMTTPEAGALEYSNNKLYLTIGSGVRKEIAFVTV